MTTRPIVSIAQLDALEAARENTLFNCGESCDHYRINDDNGVTLSGRALFARGLIAKGQAFMDDEGKRRIHILLTGEGWDLLADLASRTPSAVPEASR